MRIYINTMEIDKQKSCCSNNSWRASWMNQEVSVLELSATEITGTMRKCVPNRKWCKCRPAFLNFKMHQVTWDHTKLQVWTQWVWSESQDATFLTDLKVMMLWGARIQQVRTQSPISEHISYETLGFSLLILKGRLLGALNGMISSTWCIMRTQCIDYH